MNTLQRSAAVLASGLLLGVPGAAGAVPYTFTNIATIADSIPPGGILLSDASINSSGTVAVHVFYDAGGEAIFTGNGGPLTTIADTSGPLDGFRGPSINDSGTVAFTGFLDAGGAGIFTGNGGPLTTIADTSGPFSTFFFERGPAINNAGTVASVARLDEGFKSVIFTGSGGPTTILYEASPGVHFSDPAINDTGTVAFLAGTGVFKDRVVAGNGGPLTLIADTGGELGDLVSSPSINDSGIVAFLARFDAGGEGIFTGSGGPITTVADSSDQDVFDFPSINNSGSVAFSANIDGVGSGIFTGLDSLVEVIGRGDGLFGSSVQGVFLGQEALNDSGQLAFFYWLTDGHIGFARADPVTVPEPASLLLLGLGLAVFGVTRRRRAA